MGSGMRNEGFRMKGLFAAALIWVCALPAFPLDAAAYRRDFAENWKEAESFAREIRPLLERALNDPLLAGAGLAIVFPELSRYSYIRDVAETTALELFYIIYGAGNFSIGRFQMKPSFAAMIERDADQDCRRRYPELFKTGKTDQETRILRIERLVNLHRQVEYFAVFLRLMDKKFPSLRDDPPRLVRIFSAAYNCGYTRSQEELEKFSARCYFPYGFLGVREQYSYSDIALAYYQENK
jgi:hypothetical protein